MGVTSLWLFILTFFVNVSIGYSSKIVLIPIPIRSHVFESVNLVDGLHAKGHDIHLVLSSVIEPLYKSLLKGKNIKV